MPALSSLIREHEIISRLVESLTVYANCVKLGWHCDPGDLAHFARAFREFTDEIHHEKEESVLLPFLSRNGFRWEYGALCEVRRDHRHERYLIDVLYQTGTRGGRWTHDDRRKIAATALALVDFQREHLHMENTEVFAEAMRRLTPAALAQLEQELARFDQDVQGTDHTNELLRLMDRLIERYAPIAMAPQPARGAPAADTHTRLGAARG